MKKYKLLLILILSFEFVLYPILLIIHWWKVYHPAEGGVRLRDKLDINRKVKVCVHEWGGYNPIRTKTIKKGMTFTCGLQWQIDRFSDRTRFDLCVTMSDMARWKHPDLLERIKIYPVSNIGMDFSGYNFFYQKNKNELDSYVILTNSSVNSYNEDFIAGYINYMENNLDVGALGISYCTKMYQTLVRPNFYPHIQSFFILTTMRVLDEIVTLNHGRFPGDGVGDKSLLIRRGEIKFSQLILKAGYRLAAVDPMTKTPFKFTSFSDWIWCKGDVRQYLAQPNMIISIA